MKKNARQRVWLRLDNAAKIFPASLRPGWSNVFRLSATLCEPVDPRVLERAVKIVSRRFPSVCVSLQRGLFWYYLEENATPPAIRKEGCQPLLPMTRKEIGQCALRILYYENRMAMEVFHALTDGGGAMIFFKTLVAVYLREKKNIAIPADGKISLPEETPSPEEMEDAFLRYAGGVSAKRDPSPAFHLTGIPEKDGFLHVTCFSVPVSEILSRAKEKGVTLTTYLAALLTLCLAEIQKEKVAAEKERAVRVQIPVNLRNHFPSRTVRNFVAVYNVGLEKGETDADFEEILHRIHHQMALMNTPRHLRAVFTANVNSEKGLGIRLVPLFLKNLVMRAVFDRVGESSACLCLSNLGRVTFSAEMERELSHFDFIIGPQAKAPYNCGVTSFGEELRINVVRNTREPELEKKLFSALSSRNIPVVLESNER